MEPNLIYHGLKRKYFANNVFNKSKLNPLKQSETFLNGTLNLPTLFRLLPAPLPLQTSSFLLPLRLQRI